MFDRPYIGRQDELHLLIALVAVESLLHVRISIDTDLCVLALRGMDNILPIEGIPKKL